MIYSSQNSSGFGGGGPTSHQTPITADHRQPAPRRARQSPGPAVNHISTPNEVSRPVPMTSEPRLPGRATFEENRVYSYNSGSDDMSDVIRYHGDNIGYHGNNTGYHGDTTGYHGDNIGYRVNNDYHGNAEARWRLGRSSRSPSPYQGGGEEGVSSPSWVHSPSGSSSGEEEEGPRPPSAPSNHWQDGSEGSKRFSEDVYSRLRASRVSGEGIQLSERGNSAGSPWEAGPQSRSLKVKEGTGWQTSDRQGARRGRSEKLKGSRNEEEGGKYPPQGYLIHHTNSGDILYPTGHDPMAAAQLPGYGAAANIPTFPRTVARASAARKQQLPSQQNHVTSAADIAALYLHQQQLQLLQRGSSQLGDDSPAAKQLWRRQNKSSEFVNRTADSVSCDRHNVSYKAKNSSTSLSNSHLTSQGHQVQGQGQSRFHPIKVNLLHHVACTWRIICLVLITLCIVLLAALLYLIVIQYNNTAYRATERISSTSSSEIQSFQPLTQSLTFGVAQDLPIPPLAFSPTTFYLKDPQYLSFNVSLPRHALLGLYLRRGVAPTHTRYDVMRVLDSDWRTDVPIKTKNSQSDVREKINRVPRNAGTDLAVHQKQSTLELFLESGVWFSYFYNDNAQQLTIKVVLTSQEPVSNGCVRNCLNRGECMEGRCACGEGYSGSHCQHSICPVLCGGNGIYEGGGCKCFSGWQGRECQTPSGQCEDPSCGGGRGLCLEGRCVCAPGYSGTNCQHVVCLKSNSSDDEQCDLECVRGTCIAQRCQCEEGWTGRLCETLQCDARCEAHGTCFNGTCTCDIGWNGRHCSIDGCPSSCHNHGVCQTFNSVWRCVCRDGWKGGACDIFMETNCQSNIDEDQDGMTDCEDPDCCSTHHCTKAPSCLTAPDPMEILLRKQPPSSAASFYERMKFLIEDESAQKDATQTSFNHSQVSVIRGKVVSGDGSPLVGVRVSVVTQPLYGNTLTRELGLFDMLVNGGGSVTLSFHRQPFNGREVTVMVPWNRLITMDTVTMVLEGTREATGVQCPPGITHDPQLLKPVVKTTWQHNQLRACPQYSAVIPESQILQETIQIPHTGIHLVYRSSQTAGYMSTLLIALTPSTIPPNLSMVHLRVRVEGLEHERSFEADPGLQYKFSWDRRNAYNQKVYGVVMANVAVGYQYEGCSKIFWEVQSTTMNSFDITSTEIGGWGFHVHHTYNFQQGILHKGDGTNIYLKEWPHRLVTILGDGAPRDADCRQACDTRADQARLFAPVALASGRDGSLYVGDFNFVRRLSAGRQDVASILKLSTSDVPYKYYMTVSSLDGKLYISDYKSLRVIRVKTMGAVRDLSGNFEVIAGTGKQCLPGDPGRCGDGGPAVKAKLFYPKGIAIDKDGQIYIADGINIRLIDNEQSHIRTLIGSQGFPRYWQPLPCQQVVPVEEVTLHWPTALSINPLDNTLHVLDNGVITKLTPDHTHVFLLAGRLPHCPISSVNQTISSPEDLSIKATDTPLIKPQQMTFSPNGDLYIVESDAKKIGRVRVIDTAGIIRHYAGKNPTEKPTEMCKCEGKACPCETGSEDLSRSVNLVDPTAVTVTPDDIVHVSDMGSLRLISVHPPLPKPNQDTGEFEVIYSAARERYRFNRYGQHVSTNSLDNGQTIYNFSYNVNSYYGKLLRVSDNNNNVLTVIRDYALQAKELLLPSTSQGSDTQFKCRLSMDGMGQLERFHSPDNSLIKFQYFGGSGLLAARQSSGGDTQLYEYDSDGRLTGLVQPTGDRVGVGVGGVRNEDRRGDSNTQNDSDWTEEIRVTHPHDSYLSIDYPIKISVTFETTPYPLLSTEQPMTFTRRITLPENQTHIVQWRHSNSNFPGFSGGNIRSGFSKFRTNRGAGAMRGGGARDGPAVSSMVMDSFISNVADLSGAAQRLEQDLGQGYNKKELLINGDTLLTIEYNSLTRTETIFGRKRRDELLSINYDVTGRPAHVSSRLVSLMLNITYDAKSSRVIGWNLNDVTGGWSYDKQGRLIDRRLDGKTVSTWRYQETSTNMNPTLVTLASGHAYQFIYDSASNLQQLITPSQSRHEVSSLIELGVYRKVYKGSGVKGEYVQEWNSVAKISKIIYPGGERRVIFKYEPMRGELSSKIFYDWTAIEMSYSPRTRLLTAINMTTLMLCKEDPGFTSITTFTHQSASLISTMHITHHPITNQLTNPGSFLLVDAEFRYGYDNRFSVTSLAGTIGGRGLPALDLEYDWLNTGRLLRIGGFNFEYPQEKSGRSKTSDKNMEMIVDRDSMGRKTDVWFKFNNHVVYTLEIKYDRMGRVQQWKRTIRSSDPKAYEFTYNLDGDLTEVQLNSHSTWKYQYDPNGNRIHLDYYDNSIDVTVANGDRVEKAGGEGYVYDVGGFLIQRGEERIEYNSLELPIRVLKSGSHDVRYHYDSLSRLTARRDIISKSFLQFFYSDLSKPNRVTHFYEKSHDRVFQLIYNDDNDLVAIIRHSGAGADHFYLGLDPLGSPLVVLNSVGSVVKTVAYSPLGFQISDSASDFVLPIGYAGYISDPTSGLVFGMEGPGGRVYDSKLGRWLTAGFGRFLASVDRLAVEPRLGNLYRAEVPRRIELMSGDFPDSKISSWLERIGYRLSRLIPLVSLNGYLGNHVMTSYDLDPSMSPQLRPQIFSYQCAFTSDSLHFTQFSTRPISGLSHFSRSCFSGSRSSLSGSMSYLFRSKSKIFESCYGAFGSNQDGGLECDDSNPLPNLGHNLAPLQNFFGPGIIIHTNKDGRTSVTLLDGADDRLALLATTLLNDSLFLGPYPTNQGSDRMEGGVARDLTGVNHFIKEELRRAEDDIRVLDLRPKGVIKGLSVSVHTILADITKNTEQEQDGGSMIESGTRHYVRTVDASTRRYLDIRIRGERGVLNLRYGTNAKEEGDRLLRVSKQRTKAAAWEAERIRAKAGKLGASDWSKQQKEELLSKGRVSGYKGEWFWDVAKYSELSDWTFNIRFVNNVTRTKL